MLPTRSADAAKGSCPAKSKVEEWQIIIVGSVWKDSHSLQPQQSKNASFSAK
jgi:hypothetical protein